MTAPVRPLEGTHCFGDFVTRAGAHGLRRAGVARCGRDAYVVAAASAPLTVDDHGRRATAAFHAGQSGRSRRDAARDRSRWRVTPLFMSGPACRGLGRRKCPATRETGIAAQTPLDHRRLGAGAMVGSVASTSVARSVPTTRRATSLSRRLLWRA